MKQTIALTSSIFLAAIILAVVFYLYAQMTTQVALQEARDKAVQGCFEIAQGERTTSGITNAENWQLSQVDLNYEIISKCLQAKNIE